MTVVSLPNVPALADVVLSATDEQQILLDTAERFHQQLWDINKTIHDNPELCYKEFKAHDAITSFLEANGLETTNHAYGLDTSFVAEYGQGGRLVTLCAEYDALPGIGHGCGHNLIATAAIASFLGVVHLIKSANIPGRVRLLGCPAEEGGGGKIKLIQAGAFHGVDAALMLHPIPPVDRDHPDTTGLFDGISYGTCLAGSRFRATFKGKAAHAGAMPWLGVNALDAATLAYTAVGMLRQQIMPHDRINIIIKEGGTSSNVISDRSVIDACTRSATLKEMVLLQDRVVKCFEGAAIATGCDVVVEEEGEAYADLRPNETLCTEFTEEMRRVGKTYYCDLGKKDVGGYGTDMGNVSYECPSFHGTFVIPLRDGENIHGPGFTRAGGTEEAFNTALEAANGMAATAWKVLRDQEFASKVMEKFEADKALR
ncbi:hypothetical protein PFICI_03141 [Pestalotiopsis fici W106-1]|uniref:Peptidase M20 domain-containing protein 2 n=1 Tax=Pestalotiopsis fici (strain W106-1 / CGMCC3.15140) TaxID=1229662 RepID=W3XIQ2_PESFW|nr:uncharacterized protein PFICI_03141 [Pestalotiopsis fici W106-1]ETS85116.1 hypothetical protein PFICI_03141 [Pestalotiopsis fici W106-1]